MPDDLPYPIDEGRTHWEGCYRTARHHNCAVAEVDRLRAENERLREALEIARRGVVIWSTEVRRIAREALEATDDA